MAHRLPRAPEALLLLAVFLCLHRFHRCSGTTLIKVNPVVETVEMLFLILPVVGPAVLGFFLAC